MIVSYSITFTPTAGSLGTLIEYKKVDETTWATPTSPANPTTLTSYTLDLEAGQEYVIRISAVGVRCTAKYKYIIIPVGSCCPPNYTLSDDGTYCYRVETVAAVPPSASENAIAVSDIHFSECGSRIMDAGYTINGTGTYTVIPTSVPFWINGTGGVCNPGNTSDGPMNRAAVWATSTFPDQTVGFTFCLTVTETKVYYIGMSFDNYGQLSIDGNTIVLTDNSSTDPLMNWCIYPVLIPEGNHVIEVIGINGPGGLPNPGAIAVEIYENTREEILASTGYGTLDTIFTTAAYIGQPIQIGSDGIGYRCPGGYSLVLCDGPAHCFTTLIIPPVDCASTTTTTLAP